jgi:uracil phosphoribosyltransferase
MPANKNVFVSKHPLVADKMTKLRCKDTDSVAFRRLLKEITFYLGFEATASLSLKQKVVTTPMDMEFKGDTVHQKVAIVPILRAGLGMAEGLMELLPMAAVHHIGMYRAKGSLMPIQYYNRLPRDEACDVAYVVDPCIATSNTLCAVVSICKKWGAKKVVVIAAIAAQDGINTLKAKHPDVEMFIGTLDAKLSEDGQILPGIGDAGDRQFGYSEEIEEVEDGSPAKRARA